MPMELEAQLPNERYICNFNKNQTSQKIQFNLNVILPGLFREYNELQRLLIESRIPIDNIQTRNGWTQEKLIYSGNSDEIGSYKLIATGRFDKREQILLYAHKNNGEIGRMSDLVKVISEYTKLYEQNKKK